MNQRSESYFLKALHDAKIQEITESYTKNGFIVKDQPQKNDIGFDIVLQNVKQSKTIAFEVKLSPISNEARDQIEALRKNAERLGYEFRLVIISRPTKPFIDIEWLNRALIKYLIDNPIQDLDELATHVRYEHVETTIDAVRIKSERATANIYGTIDLELQYGSATDLTNDVGHTTTYSAPFEGDVELDLTAQTIEAARLRVDLSEWNGE